ncbi:multidrug efflux SMR transporter [Halobacterium sp. CBA1126]|uniref:DMT family transporter n=1 Tax=Halobacterium sp. CBA1126 TaxID=2668074 RepID=UPI0012F949AB|nr:multidrug efflux SMR transporter [Halobacterium sp. CBA1126]MUV60963.1 ligand-binding protein SH3 [Halobacterium sp. CBA1126]
MSPWLVLLVAGLFETIWAIGLVYTDGFTDPLPSTATLAAMGVSVYLLSRAVQQIPVGTAYAVWTGIGAVSTAILGVYLFDEPVSALRVACIAIIVVGIAGLQVTSSGHA